MLIDSHVHLETFSINEISEIMNRAKSLADDTPYTCEELMSDIRKTYPDTPIPYYDISWEQIVSITNIKQTKLEGDNDISCRGNVILKNSPFNETEGEIYFFKDRNWWYYQITPLE